MRDVGWVFDIRRFSLHDGPGIRTTVFLKGCPLRCTWCHNPESQAHGALLLHRPDRCVACSACVGTCPTGAIALVGGAPVTDTTACILCGACADACPAEARQVVGRRVSVAEVLATLERDRVFYAESGGGVTLSGGEPLAQPQFAGRLLRACRERGLHTALDTSGHAPIDTLVAVARWADLILYDLKHVDDDAHRRGTGVSNHTILANLRHLLDVGANVVVRVPLVPGFNDRAADLRAIAAYLAYLHVSCAVDLLPFHAAASSKHRRFGLPYHHEGSAPQDAEQLRYARACFTHHGIETSIGG